MSSRCWRAQGRLVRFAHRAFLRPRAPHSGLKTLQDAFPEGPALRALGPETLHWSVSETALVPVSTNIPAGGSARRAQMQPRRRRDRFESVGQIAVRFASAT